jgi:hypothetical protein
VRTTDLTEGVFFALSRRESVPARAGLRMSVSGSFCEERGQLDERKNETREQC